MKRWIAVISLCVVPWLSVAAEKVDQTLEVDENGVVYIDIMNGQADIRGWDKNQVHVKGTLDRKAEEFIFITDNGRTTVKVKMPKRNHHNNGNDGSDLVIFVPKQHEVNFTGVNTSVEVRDIDEGVNIVTVNGEVSASNINQWVTLETVNGDINAEYLSGRIRLETVNGEVRNRSSVGKLTVTTVNGDIDIVSEAESISVSNVNGDMELDLGKADDVDITTVNGSIDGKFAFAGENGRISATSVSGRLTMSFDDEDSIRFRVVSHAGGRIVNKLTSDDVRRAKYGPSSDLSFSMNGGDNTVDISTVGGRVTIK